MKIAAALLLLCLPAPLAAQGRGRQPVQDHFALNSSYSGRGDFLQRSAGFSSAFALGSAGPYALSASASAAHLRTLTRGPFPGELYEASLGLRAAGRSWSFAGGARSNSDRPFNSASETDFSLDASRALSSSGRHSLLFGVSYSSRRSFLKGVPFPYLSYAYRSETLTLFLPFSAVWKFREGCELSASYSPPKYFSLSLARRFTPALQVAVYGGTRLSQYLPAGRPDKDEALFLELPYAGLRAVVTPAGGWETAFWSAWGFKGAYFTGEQYDRRHGETRTGAGPAAGLELKRPF